MSREFEPLCSTCGSPNHSDPCPFCSRCGSGHHNYMNCPVVLDESKRAQPSPHPLRWNISERGPIARQAAVDGAREALADLEEHGPPCLECKHWRAGLDGHNGINSLYVRLCWSPHGQQADFDCFTPVAAEAPDRSEPEALPE